MNKAQNIREIIDKNISEVIELDDTESLEWTSNFWEKIIRYLKAFIKIITLNISNIELSLNMISLIKNKQISKFTQFGWIVTFASQKPRPS